MNADARYYWIRYKNPMHGREPFIAEFHNDKWWLTGQEDSVCPCDVEIVSELLQPPPSALR